MRTANGNSTSVFRDLLGAPAKYNPFNKDPSIELEEGDGGEMM